MACVQDQIGSTNNCDDCVCFVVGTILGNMCDTCSAGSSVSVSCILYTFLAFLTMKLYDFVLNRIKIRSVLQTIAMIASALQLAQLLEALAIHVRAYLTHTAIWFGTPFLLFSL